MDNHPTQYDAEAMASAAFDAARYHAAPASSH